jgi:hypothetical protein
MTNATPTRLSQERRERDDNRYLDPASERYATQLAAVVFGWGTWSVGPLADEDALVDSCRTRADASAGDGMDVNEAWAVAMTEANVRST